MDIDDIKDRESLEAWLKTRPREDAVAIAHRAALRVFPLFGPAMREGWALKNNSVLLPVLRCLLVTDAARAGGSEDFRTSAFLAREALFLGMDPPGVAGDVAYAAGDATQTVFDVAHSAASSAVFHAASASEIATLFELSSGYRKLDFADLPSLLNELGVGHLPLWPDTPPDWFTQADSETRAIWAESPEHWEFWTRWWDAAIAGTPLDWDLQRDIALQIPDGLWRQGPGPVAEAIRQIEARHARALTANGEAIVVNPGTGLARLVAETDLPDDIAAYARRKMETALRRFGPELDNQYRPLEPALARLRETLEDSAALPVELFDACASSSRMVANFVRNDAVPSPETDARISEYVTLIREAGADILAHDAQTQNILTRRNAIQGNTALIDNADAIRFTADQLAEASEGALPRLMRRDAEIATDPKADAEDRKDSTFRLASRILRYGAIAGGAVAATGGFIAASKEIAWLGGWIVARPEFQQALAAILRWLNLG